MNIRIFKRRNSAISIFVLLAGVAGMSGCATPSTYQGMTATGVAVAEKHAGGVTVTVGGGKATSSMGASQISDDAFKQAIIESIKSSQVFAAVNDTGGDYQLNATIISMDQPTFGLSFTVKMECGWTLKRSVSGEVVWQEVVKSEHTATTSDAFAGVTRLRMANEGAAKNNISQALEKISKLKL